jgi:hypothetical protein
MGEHQIWHVVPTRDRRNTSSSPEAIPGIIPLHGGIEMNAVTQNRPRRFPWFKPEKQSEAEHPHRRPLMLRQEILQMPPDEQLIPMPGMRPIRARKIRWFEEPEFVRRRLAPPIIPQLVVEIPMDDGATAVARPRRQAVPAPTVPAIGECSGCATTSSWQSAFCASWCQQQGLRATRPTRRLPIASQRRHRKEATARQMAASLPWF